MLYNPFTHYIPVTFITAAPTAPLLPPLDPLDPFEAANPKQVAVLDHEAKAAQKKKHWQAQATKRKQARADKRYGSREQAAFVLAESEVKQKFEKKYQMLTLDRRLDNKHHMRLIARKKVARSPNEVSMIHTEIKALIVKINQTKAEIRLLKGAKPETKANTPKGYRVDTKMDAATKAAFQNS